jgi:glutamate dehydrogenase
MLYHEPFAKTTGIDDTYFQNAPVEEIVSHIISLYGSKMLAYAREDQKLDINLEKESENNAVSFMSSTHCTHVLDLY